MKFYVTRKILVGIILALCGIIFLMATSGCGKGVVRSVVSVPVKDVVAALPKAEPDNRSKEQANVDASNDRIANLEGELAKERAALKQNEEALRKKDYAALRNLAFIVAGIAFLATCVAIAAAFFLPAFKKPMLMGALACVCVIVVSLSFEAMLAYVPWIGGAIVVGLIAWLILALCKSRTAIRLTAQAGDRFANALTDNDITAIKEQITVDQIKAGVRNIIQDARGKLT